MEMLKEYLSDNFDLSPLWLKILIISIPVNLTLAAVIQVYRAITAG